jgi:enoyl-CoA hydratase/carnithine racemase
MLPSHDLPGDQPGRGRRRVTTPVRIAVADGVATVTVDNPPVTALADPVLEALGAVAEAIGADDAVRAVVLTGAGERSFLAGADLAAFERMLGDPDAMRAHVELTGRIFGAWAVLPQAVIAAVRGHAAGGGLELALTCDFIVADPGARLGLPEVGLGLIPGAGGTQRLPRRVGLGIARRMLLTGALLRAADAHEAGLVDVVAAERGALDEAHGLAARLAALPAAAVRAAKQALRAAESQPLDDGLAAERQLFLAVAGSADAREGASAFLHKRQPQFIHA